MPRPWCPCHLLDFFCKKVKKDLCLLQHLILRGCHLRGLGSRTQNFLTLCLGLQDNQVLVNKTAHIAT